MNLYAQTNDYLQVKMVMDSILSEDYSEHAIANWEGHPEFDQELLDLKESFKNAVVEKAGDVAKYVKELQAVAAFQKAEAASLKAEAEKTLAKADKVMANVAECLNAMELKEVQAGAYKFKFKAGSTVTEVDEKLLPKAYWVQPPTVVPPKKPLSKPELKKLVDSGISIEGVKVIKNPDKLELK